MSKSITDYFNVLPKKKTGGNSSSERNDRINVKELSSSPDKQQKSAKRRNKRQVLTDSEDDEVMLVEEKSSKSRSKERGKTPNGRDASISRSPKKRQEPVKRSNKKHILSDSEDEVDNVKQKSKKPRSDERKEEKAQKIVSAADMFSSKPVKRTAAPKPQKKLAEQDDEIFLDDTIEAQLDELEKSATDQDLLKGTNSNKNGKDNHDKNVNKLSSEIGSKKNDNDSHKTLNPVDDSVDEKRNKVNGVTIIGEKGSDKKKHSEPPESSKKNTNDKSRVKRISKLEVDKEPVRKRKRSNDDEEIDPIEASIQKKKQHLALYQQYLQRGGARNPGSKEIPTGADNCLAGLSFLITGVLDSMERDDADELIKKYGGHIQHAVTKKTDYIIAGDEPGPAKMEKAKKFQIKVITEDDLLELIRTRPAGRATVTPDDKPKPRKTPVKSKQKTPEPEPLTATRSDPFPKTENGSDPKSKLKLLDNKSKSSSGESTSATKASSSVSNKSVIPPTDRVPCEIVSQAWVEKYKPKSMKQIIGQQGDKSNANKLHNWLKNWRKNQNGDVKHSRPSPWAQHDGSFFKAALLSGPPGVGKTTTVQLVCDALQLDAIEFNASDTRSKRLLKEEVSELLNNKSMKSYFVGGSMKKPDLNHVLVMDEVDGMAGNEDRGGLQELIALIKTTNVPVICICNDRNNPKMRTLSNYTFDLKFQKPRIEQIRSAMMSICFREKIELAKEDLDRLIESTNNDVRQILNHLSLLTNNSLTNETPQRRKCNKDLRLGPWEVVQKVFTSEVHKTMSIHEKSDLFFNDYNIAPLFVQENYLGVVPNCPKNKVLETVANAAESLALGDLVENSIRGSGAWSLLPMQACYSSVIPGTLMSGHITRQITFPSWLGQNSRRTKFDRLLQEITTHTRLATMSSKDAINLDYIKPLRDAVLRPLAELGSSGASPALEVMNHYSLLREDLDSLVEVSLWPGNRDPMQVIDSKVKAAFTRAYNKSSLMRPYAFTKGGTEKKKRAQITYSEDIVDGEGEELESENDDNDDDDNEEPVAQVKKAAASTSKKAAGTAKKGAAESKKKSSNPRAGKSKANK